MANDVVKFDVEGVKKDMNSLETLFTDFAEKLKKINDYMETMINAGEDSAIYGEYGNKMFQIWSANAATFGDFHSNFQAWSEAVAIISANNEEFVVDTLAMYRDNGSSLNGVKEAREFVEKFGRNGDTSQLGDAAKVVMGNASKTVSGATLFANGVPLALANIGMLDKDVTKQSKQNGVTTCTWEKDGYTYIAYYDKDGNLVGYQKASSYNGNPEYFDANGKSIGFDEYLKNVRVAQSIQSTTGTVTSIPSGAEKASESSDRIVYSWYDDAGNHHTAVTDLAGTLVGQVIFPASGGAAMYYDGKGNKFSDYKSYTSNLDTQLANGTKPQASTSPTTNAASVTVRSGQKVKLNGEDVYFLMRDSQGNMYYTKGTDANAQVFVVKEDGALQPYTDYNGNISSRSSFVSSRKQNMDYTWNVTYNDGNTPYDSVSTSVDTSFTSGVTHSDYTYVYNDMAQVKSDAVSLESINFGDISQGKAELPEVIYVAPGDDIRWDPTDFLDQKDIHIEGGKEGRYLVLDKATNTYYTMNDKGEFKANGGNDFSYSAISADRLLSSDTEIKTK